MIERSAAGVYRLPLLRGWAVGFYPGFNCNWMNFHRYPSGGWEMYLIWFYVGRRPRENWTHWKGTEGK